MEFRIEHDTMGEIAVPAERHWGAQTQRSVENFKIGGEKQPKEIITAFAYLKEACARANEQVGKLTAEQADAVANACREIRSGKWDEEFPLVVWQTGSGTQTNMNVNEVIAHLTAKAGVQLHPNGVLPALRFHPWYHVQSGIPLSHPPASIEIHLDYIHKALQTQGKNQKRHPCCFQKIFLFPHAVFSCSPPRHHVKIHHVKSP